MLRWGILGTGSICGQFVRDLAHVPDAAVAAVASRSMESASAFARDHAIPVAHADYAALFADPAVDIVYIGTPHTLHLANAAAALRAGKHVLCEKPLTVTPDEARALIAVQRETGRYLMEAMWTWFLPAIAQARRWIAEGRIGALRHVQADFGYPQRGGAPTRMYDPALGGGALLDMGIYPVALTWLLHPAMPGRIEVVGRRAPSGVDDDLVALLEYPEHTATLATSFRAKLNNIACIVGDDGHIVIPDFWRASEARLYELDTCVDRFVDPRAHQGFAYEAAAVGADIAAGRTESPVVTLADSLAIQELMAAISARLADQDAIRSSITSAVEKR